MTAGPTDDELTTYPSPRELLQALRLRDDGFLLVNEADLIGLVETQPGQRDVAIHLQGEESTPRYAVPLLRQRDAIALAKQILRRLEPSALDPESQILRSLRRIEGKLGITSED